MLAMAVVAVLLAMVVAAAATGGGGGGGETGIDPPTASFVFETSGTDVNVTLYGGETLDGEAIYVESAVDGTLGNLAGTDDRACATNVTRMRVGDSCVIEDATRDTLYLVWRSGGDRYILDRRYGDPTPTPFPTPSPAATPTLTATPTESLVPGTSTPTVVPGNGAVPPDGGAGNGTVTPTPGGDPTETQTSGTPPETRTAGTPTEAPRSGAPTATPPPTPTRTPTSTESA